MISLKNLLSSWGFTDHPFEAYTAENEPRLNEYFVAPPYLDDMLGSSKAPVPAVVFGARGIGKSAIRIHIEALCLNGDPDNLLNGKTIAITYDDFNRALQGGLEHVSLDKHLSALLSKMVCAALARISKELGASELHRENIEKKYPSLNIEVFSRLVRRYFKELTDVQQEAAFRGVYDFFRNESVTFSDRANFFNRAWSQLRGPIIDIANIFLAARGKNLVTATQIEQHSQQNSELLETVLADFTALSALTPQLDLDSWYILIDKVDEDERTDSNAAKSAKLVAPLLKNLKVLETPNVGFKFFLWNQLRTILNGDNIRLDKIKNWSMTWTTDELKAMIDSRLSAYSNDKTKSLNQIVTDDLKETIYDLVINHAMRSPREIAQVIDAIFREHARHSSDESGQIAPQSLDRGLDEYSLRRAIDLFSAETVQQFSKIKKTSFTSTDIQSTFKIAQQSASTRIQKWEDDGYIERIDDTRSLKDSSKYVYQYTVKDARLKRIIERGLNEE